MNLIKKNNKPADIVQWAVEWGRKCGAQEIEVGISDGTEFSVEVRHGEIENLVEAGSRHIDFRIIKDLKTTSASSSDLKQTTLRALIKRTVERAEESNADSFSGLPEFTAASAPHLEDLNLFDSAIAELTPENKLRLALETEKIALSDKRITNSHGASFDTNEIETVLANSKGFFGSYRETFCSLSLGLQAGDTNDKVEDFASCTKRHFRDLDSPEDIASRAVERTVRQLNPRRIPTQNIPVIFEPRMTSWLMGFLFSCITGTAVYQGVSFLADKLGRQIGRNSLTVIDDGRLPARLGSSPFDAEGVPTGKTIVVEKGTLKNFLCDTYAARKLGLRSTGNANGGSVGPNNFFLSAGEKKPEEILRGIKKGLLLTRTIGHGLNPVTGDISRGAFGLWVEDGAIAFPVSEITVSGNLGRILYELEAVGSDLDFRSPVCGPTLKVAEMTVAGEST